MTLLSAKLTVPAASITSEPLNLVPVSGYTCHVSPDASSLELRYWIDGVNDPTAPDPPFGAPPILGPHTIDVYDGTTLVYTFTLTEKQPHTHFRYPPLTSIVKHPPSWLVSNGYMFPFGAPDMDLATVNPVTYDGPNGFAGMARAMGTTGERPDIGLVTEWSAKYMMDGDPKNLLNTAECASNAPCFFIDLNTGKPVDKLKYTKANNYGGGPGYRGSPWLPPANAPYGDPVVVAFDIEHCPEVSYLAGLITEDQWHLFNIQGWVEMILLTDADSTPDGTGPVIFAPTLTREFAWGLRTIVMCEVLTKFFESLGPLRADCMPSSYYTTIIANIRQYYIENRLNGLDSQGNPDPLYKTFNVFETNADDGVEWWQEDYKGGVLAWMVLTKHADWNDVYLWCLGNQIARTNGTSGFPPSYPCPYWTYMGAKGARLASWAEVWTVTASPPPNTTVTPNTGVAGGNLGNLVTPAMLAAVTADPYCGGNFAPGTNTEYPQMTRGVLSMALYLHALKTIDVLTPFPQLPTCYANVQRMFVNLDTQVAPLYLHGSYSYDNRDAETFDPTLLAPSVVLQLTPGAPPPPVTNPPPSGGDNPPPNGTGDSNMQFDPGSVGTITVSNPKDKDGKADPFVTGDTLSFQILNSADQSVAADQGSFGTPVFAADNLSVTVPFTRPQATGVFLLRPTVTNVDGTPAVGTDVPFGVAVPVDDITTFDTAIS